MVPEEQLTLSGTVSVVPFDLQQCLSKKKLPADLFDPNKQRNPIDFSDPIERHVAWLFQNIYSLPYPNRPSSSISRNNIVREVHGIQHVTRCALLVPVWANLYRKYGDTEARGLTPEDLKLMQIATLLHDAARENEGQDLWDHESGVFVYLYLVKILKIDSPRARLFAEAVANKDWSSEQPYTEIYEKDDELICRVVLNGKGQRNIYQKIIHDSDCIDVIRARRFFDPEYLDFYQEIASGLEAALDDMAELILEGRSLIVRHGDCSASMDLKIKQGFELENCWSETEALIAKHRYPLLKKMGHELLSDDVLIEQNEEKMDADELLASDWMRDLNGGKIFARGIFKPLKHNPKHNETDTEKELRKMWREELVATLSGSKKKNGSTARSVARLGHGVALPTQVGFLIRNPDLNSFYEIAARNLITGRGKKKAAALIGFLRKEDARNQLDALLKIQKMAGKDSVLPVGGRTPVSWQHTEQTIRINTVDAVYYSRDQSDDDGQHEYAPFLKAWYILKCYQKIHDAEFEKRKDFYEKKYKKEAPYEHYIKKHGVKEIPLIEISAVHNELRIIPQEEFSNEKIRDMWLILCEDFFKEFESLPDFFNFISSREPSHLKNFILFRDWSSTAGFGTHASADDFLPKEMRDEISGWIASRKKNIKNDDVMVRKTKEARSVLESYGDSLLCLEADALLDFEAIKLQEMENIKEIWEKSEVKTLVLSSIRNALEAYGPEEIFDQTVVNVPPRVRTLVGLFSRIYPDAEETRLIEKRLRLGSEMHLESQEMILPLSGAQLPWRGRASSVPIEREISIMDVSKILQRVPVKKLNELQTAAIHDQITQIIGDINSSEDYKKMIGLLTDIVESGLDFKMNQQDQKKLMILHDQYRFNWAERERRHADALVVRFCPSASSRCSIC